MELNQPIFDIEESTAFVGSDSFQFVDNLDSFVPQVSIEIPHTMDWDEDISLDFSFSSDGIAHDPNQSTAADEYLTEEQDDLNWTLSLDHHDVEDSTSIKLKDEDDTQMSYEENSPVKTEECGLRIPWEDDKNDPVLKVVDEGQSKGQVTQLCEFCGKLLSDKGNLKRHQDNIHLGLKPFSCDLCGKRYFAKDLMIYHRRIHTGEKPFPCGICDKRYRRKEHLKKHINWHISLYLEYNNKMGKLELD